MYFLFCIKFAVYITKKPNDANGALEPLVFEIQYNPAVVSLLKSEMFLFTATPRNTEKSYILGVARIKKQTIAPGEEVVIMSITETSLVCVGQRASSGGNPGVFVLTSLGKEAQITEGYGIVLGGSEPTTGSLWVHCDTISGLWKVKNVYTSNRALSVAVILLENG